MDKEKMTVFAQNAEMTAEQIKEKLPLMLQHVVRFYEVMCPKEFVGAEKLKQIRIIDWAFRLSNDSEQNFDETENSEEFKEVINEVSLWVNALRAIPNSEKLTDENITKPAFRKSGLLNLPLILNGKEMLQPRDYYVEQFIKNCKSYGIH